MLSYANLHFRNSTFRVDPGTLAFSVTIFCIEAVICMIVIVLRRHPSIGGELGGPRKIQARRIKVAPDRCLLAVVSKKRVETKNFCFLSSAKVLFAKVKKRNNKTVYILQILTALFFSSLWFIYLILSALESYCIITGF